MIQRQQQLERRRKTKLKGQQNSFTCFLIYFVVKSLFILIIYKYDNYLKHQPSGWIIFIGLAIINTYLMLFTGKDSGFQDGGMQENQLLNFQRSQNNYCSICNCRKKNRSKHCFYCGKCVRKFDHHCPWIGACVGQNNQRLFWLLLLAHTLQSSYAFHICYQSKNLFQYQFDDGHFSPEYGVFVVFSIFMVIYIIFAGGLLLFHSFLIVANYTSKELFQRNKCRYLDGVKGNPFSEGIIKNIIMCIVIEQNGRQWLIDSNSEQRQKNRSFLQNIWSNDYYSCC